MYLISPIFYFILLVTMYEFILLFNFGCEEEVVDSVRLGAGVSKLYVVETTNTLAYEPSGLQGHDLPSFASFVARG